MTQDAQNKSQKFRVNSQSKQADIHKNNASVGLAQVRPSKKSKTLHGLELELSK